MSQKASKQAVRVAGWRRRAAFSISALAAAFPFSGCNFGEFTSTVTLDGRQVVTYLVRSAILTPIQTAIDGGIDYLFDRLEDGD
ncbi:MAG TPA: hypothetical protein PKC49_11960 [Phycisphaerae bacterium]|nr:hypothetical protein [Phycisphaerae bacterium]